MPTESPRTQSSSVPNIKFALVAGAAAGDVTVTGIKARDKLLFVAPLDGSADLTSEFSVTADDTINNTGGTSTATKVVQVVWSPEPAGL